MPTLHTIPSWSQSSPITITVTLATRNNGRLAGRFDAQHGERLLAMATRQPMLDGARVLLQLGFDPGTILVMRHAGSDVDAMRATIGVAAGLIVQETASGPSGPVPKELVAAARQVAVAWNELAQRMEKAGEGGSG